ncbi:MAG: hypothetical protein ACTSUE_16750 [Promethearchaeota archaeon]
MFGVEHYLYEQNVCIRNDFSNEQYSCINGTVFHEALGGDCSHTDPPIEVGTDGVCAEEAMFDKVYSCWSDIPSLNGGEIHYTVHKTDDCSDDLKKMKIYFGDEQTNEFSQCFGPIGGGMILEARRVFCMGGKVVSVTFSDLDSCDSESEIPLVQDISGTCEEEQDGDEYYRWGDSCVGSLPEWDGGGGVGGGNGTNSTSIFWGGGGCGNKNIMVVIILFVSILLL